MTPADFKHWRKLLGLSQKEAAEALGLKRRVVQYYEKGERDGDEVSVPKIVRLACWALQSGISDYRGPIAAQEAPPALGKGGAKRGKKAAKAARDSGAESPEDLDAIPVTSSPDSAGGSDAPRPLAGPGPNEAANAVPAAPIAGETVPLDDAVATPPAEAAAPPKRTIGRPARAPKTPRKTKARPASPAAQSPADDGE
ncbi:XRE family transcriptional regulator [Rhodospirillum rubrum]|uniref:helix-turn-helix domain-containing protein n=1 Tax=Rhodospirillum rubrum TaxID=1085 RepID=UPI00190503F3|nr:helix-turn-helix transcriptional regulator [Rhodospirillum rubrum]MBK1664021.1 XRE family transcriptional regulator [Rhodospirillum rubrum]MBK1675421.1 XRE family transcriptional regulator [Rhodospirillum rubrum]